ncbi:lipid A-modifier LpxR family protein [Loktanella agnita]|uniref:lipid A-modifier LpxR family protein n=1 Tax=Loktanella agnita TaxID=287097 RepID=UPI003989299C
MLYNGFGRCTVFGLIFLSLSTALSGQVSAENAQSYRGEVGSFTNDFFGDGHDRWRSGSYQRSYYSEGPKLKWAEGLELRARSEIVTPWTPSNQPEGDVPYSTSLAFAAFAHNSILGFDTRIGGEVLLMGDASGMEMIQRTTHDSLGMDESFDPSRGDFERVGNGVAFRFEAEVGRSFNITAQSMLRPYTEVTLGADQAASVGADLVIGPMVSADTWTRDVVTGRLLTPQVNEIQGLSFIAGWDVRSVNTSVHFPAHSAVELEEIQYRSRVGFQNSTNFANYFIGQAWLSPSFVGQVEPQRLGMLSISFTF